MFQNFTNNRIKPYNLIKLDTLLPDGLTHMTHKIEFSYFVSLETGPLRVYVQISSGHWQGGVNPEQVWQSITGQHQERQNKHPCTHTYTRLRTIKLSATNCGRMYRENPHNYRQNIQTS